MWEFEYIVMLRVDASWDTRFSVCEGCGSEKCLLHLAAPGRLHVQVTVPEKIRSIQSEGYESQVINYQFAYDLEVTRIYACQEVTLIVFIHAHSLDFFLMPRFANFNNT